uniref:Secreted protein n=1 Tax=Macrostomum lignano TaxID=282301 RepID=A0A1I8HN56_9PLAT
MTLTRRATSVPLELISRFVPLSWMEKLSSCRSGTLLARSVSAPSPRLIIEAPMASLWCTIAQTKSRSTTLRIGYKRSTNTLRRMSTNCWLATSAI